MSKKNGLMRGFETTILTLGIIILTGAIAPAFSQEVPPNITKEDLAKNNKLFIELAAKALHWDEPADPIKIVRPLYFVGSRGLSSWLFATSQGLILLNTGMTRFCSLPLYESATLLSRVVRVIGPHKAEGPVRHSTSSGPPNLRTHQNSGATIGLLVQNGTGLAVIVSFKPPGAVLLAHPPFESAGQAFGKTFVSGK